MPGYTATSRDRLLGRRLANFLIYIRYERYTKYYSASRDPLTRANPPLLAKLVAELLARKNP
jgi:hypothetical protein